MNPKFYDKALLKLELSRIRSDRKAVKKKSSMLRQQEHRLKKVIYTIDQLDLPLTGD